MQNLCSLANQIRSLKPLNDDNKLTKEEIAKYLGMTRQTLSKIFDEIPVTITKKNEQRLYSLLDNEIVCLDKSLAIIQLYNMAQNLIPKLGEMQTSEIGHYEEIIKYVAYWNDNNFKMREYMKKINLHVQNFHMRTNPYYLFFHEFFHKDLAPLLTFDIDYDKNLVCNVTLGSIVENDYTERGYDLNYQKNWDELVTKKSLPFEEFITNLRSYYDGKVRYNLFLDTVDNEFHYISSKISKKYRDILSKINYLELDRVFRTIDDERYLEEIVSEFFDIDKGKFVQNAKYRNKYLIKLIRLVSGYNQIKHSKLDKIMKASDSENYDKSKQLSKEVKERRKLKMGKH